MNAVRWYPLQNLLGAQLLNLIAVSGISSNFPLHCLLNLKQFFSQAFFFFYAADKTILSKILKDPTNLKAPVSHGNSQWKFTPQKRLGVPTSSPDRTWKRKNSPAQRKLKVAPVFHRVLLMVSERPPEFSMADLRKVSWSPPRRVGGCSFAMHISADTRCSQQRELDP